MNLHPETPERRAALSQRLRAATGLDEAMRDERDDHGSRLHEVDEIAYGDELPKGAGNSWRALNVGTARFAECLDAVFPAIPYCIDLIGGRRLETDPAACVAFRPKGS